MRNDDLFLEFHSGFEGEAWQPLLLRAEDILAVVPQSKGKTWIQTARRDPTAFGFGSGERGVVVAEDAQTVQLMLRAHGSKFLTEELARRIVAREETP